MSQFTFAIHVTPLERCEQQSRDDCPTTWKLFARYSYVSTFHPERARKEMATQASTHTESPLTSHRMLDQPFASSRSSPIDLTNESDDLTERRQMKKPRLDVTRGGTPTSTMSSMTISTPESVEDISSAYTQQQIKPHATLPVFGSNIRQNPLSQSVFRPHVLGPSSSSPLFASRRVQTASLQSPAVTGPNLSNSLRSRNSEVIDLTISPSPPPQPQCRAFL